MKFAPEPVSVHVERAARQIEPGDLSRLDHVVVFLPRTFRDKDLAGAPFAPTLKVLRKRAPDARSIAVGVLQARRQVGITVATLGKTADTFARLTLARHALTAASRSHPGRIGFVSLEKSATARSASARAFTAAVFAAAVDLPNYKSDPTEPVPVSSLTLFGRPSVDLERLRVEADANNLARWITGQPPNLLDARAMIDGVTDLAAERGLAWKVYEDTELARMGANAFLAVARANSHGDAGIVHLCRRARGPRVALVGKGVCYDTGGVNVKPAGPMFGMHGDMQGSAVALASFFALAKLAPSMHLDCYLAITENRIDSNAYTPNEIVAAMNGTTIEVVHSDAEGRMALADTLVLASRGRPDLIVDYATLTGACVSALASRYSGVFTNRDALHAPLIAAGRSSGERIWPFPLDADFDAAIESRQADVKQCATSGLGDHIQAARFLTRFVPPSIPWVHMDLAASNHKGGLGHVATEITGFGVLVTTRFLLDEGALETLGE